MFVIWLTDCLVQFEETESLFHKTLAWRKWCSRCYCAREPSHSPTIITKSISLCPATLLSPAKSCVNRLLRLNNNNSHNSLSLNHPSTFSIWSTWSTSWAVSLPTGFNRIRLHPHRRRRLRRRPPVSSTCTSNVSPVNAATARAVRLIRLHQVS